MSIELEIRKLRLQKQNLESDVKKLEPKKNSLISDISKIKEEAIKEQNRKKDIQKKNQSLEAEGKEVKNEMNKNKEDIKVSRRGLEDDIANNDQKMIGNEKALSVLNSREKKLKADKAIHAQEITVFKEEKDRFYAEKENSEKVRIDESKELAEKSNVLEDKLNKVAEQLDRANTLKEKLSKEATEQKKEKEDLKYQEDVYKASQKAFAVEQEKSEKARIEYEIAKEATTKQEVSFKAQLKKLDGREKELDIKELKIKKLIRDKGIDDELKRLKETVK